MKKLPLILVIFLVSFFAISKINPFPLLAQEEVSEKEFEFITPENNIFCNDFELTYENHYQDGTATEGATLQSEERNNCYPKDATIKLIDEKTKQPDFTILNSRLQSTYPKLMPLQLGERVDLDPDPIETIAKHFWIRKEEPTSCTLLPSPSEKEKEPVLIAKTQVILNDWWAQLLSGTKIFCGLFSASKERCIPPEKLAIRVERQPAGAYVEDPGTIAADINISELPYAVDCSKSKKFTNETPPKLTTIEERISFFANWFKQTFANKNASYFLTEETAGLINKTRGVMVGGHTLTNQSEFLSDFISYGINSSLTEKPLASNADYEITGVSYNNEGEADQVHYEEQKQVWGRNCLQLCALYPPRADFSISDIDPICPSCNPEDYYKAE